MTAIVHEILLPEGKPDFEWVRGRALQKMSPATVHSFVQKALVRIMSTWAEAHKAGQVGPEWRVRILPEGSTERRPLTPDVAFFTKAQLATISRQDDRDVAYPPFAPEIAFEVISKLDESADIKAKRLDYLSAGTRRVVEVYPTTREMRVWISPDESFAFAVGSTWTDAAYPGLTIRVADLFEDYDAYLADLGE
jgi:Uma2 family endonuclease